MKFFFIKCFTAWPYILTKLIQREFVHIHFADVEEKPGLFYETMREERKESETKSTINTNINHIWLFGFFSSWLPLISSLLPFNKYLLPATETWRDSCTTFVLMFHKMQTMLKMFSPVTKKGKKTPKNMLFVWPWYICPFQSLWRNFWSSEVKRPIWNTMFYALLCLKGQFTVNNNKYDHHPHATCHITCESLLFGSLMSVSCQIW